MNLVNPVYCFRWSRLGIITTNEDLMISTAVAVKEALERDGKDIYFRTIDTTVDGTEVWLLFIFWDILTANL